MNIITKHRQTLEFHQIELRYLDARIRLSARIKQMTYQMATEQQRLPIIVIPSLQPQYFILIDGYIRFEVIKRLGLDTIDAEVWSCDSLNAHAQYFLHQRARNLAALEESLLMRQLQIEHHLSQSELARRLGCHQSFINRRIMLTEDMPEFVAQAIRLEYVSIWCAQRVVIPMARAIDQHAEQFIDYLKQHYHSTRQIYQFYEHYLKQTAPIKNRMINDPELFFKSLQVEHISKQSKQILKGPEDKWIQTLKHIRSQLSVLNGHVQNLFSHAQETQLRQRLLQEFEQTHTFFNCFADNLRKCNHA